MGYLSFDEYQELGGKCPADIFPLQQFDVEAKMDYITFGRLSKMIKKLETVPEDIKMIEVIIINNSGLFITILSSGKKMKRPLLLINTLS